MISELFKLLFLFIFGVFIIIPVYSNMYKEEMWTYIKGKIEEENKRKK